MQENDPGAVPPHRARNTGIDPATQRLIWIAGALGAGLLVLVLAWSMGAHRQGVVPVIEAASGPVRVKPDNPGGMQVAGASDQALADEDPENGKLAPAAEAPNVAELHARMRAAQSEAAQSDAARSVQADEAARAGKHPPAARPTPLEQTDADQADNDEPSPSGGGGTAASPTEADRIKAARQEPEEAESHEPARSATKPGSSGAGPSGAGPSSASASGSGVTQVQLAALDSEHAAQAEWERLRHKWPGLLADHEPVVTRAEIGGRTYYRLRTGGFATMAQATDFCAALRAKGAACSLAAF